MPDVTRANTRKIRIPCTAVSRREPTYAKLVQRVITRFGKPWFEGPLFRCGAAVEETALRPTPEYPEIPLLIEFAGPDRAGGLQRRPNWGHRKYRDMHIVWRWNAEHRDWDEIARALSQGPEWMSDLAAVIKREINAPPPAYVEVAGDATARVLSLLDAELAALEQEGRGRVMSFLYDQFTARMTEHV